MTESDADSRLHWYQRTGLWVAVAGVAVPVAFVVGLGNYLSVQSRVVGVLAVGVVGLAHLGLWMGALVARRPWARGMLSILTLVVLGLLIWAVWNGLQNVEADALAACVLVDTPDGQVVEFDPELCASVVSGDFGEEFDSLRRNMWIVVAAIWVAPLFILYAMRRRFPPSRIETEASATTDLVVGILLMIVGLFIVLSFAVGFVYGPGVPEVVLPGVLTVFVLLMAVTLVPGVLLIRSARRLRRRLSLAGEPSDQHQEEDRGLSGWIVAAVVVAAVALLSVPLWFLIQAGLDADPTPAADGSGEETGEVAPLGDTDTTGELLTESAGVDLPEGVVGVVFGTVALDAALEGTVLLTPGATLDCGGHTIRGSDTQAGVIMANDATVRNCLISGFNTGVALTATDGALVENVEVTNSRIGFYLVNGTTNATITGSTAAGNEIGFLFEPSVSSVHIEANTAARNWRSGFMIGHTDDSVFIGNTVTTGGSGFWITNSNRNQFLGNTVNGATEWFSIGVFEGSSDNLFQGNEVTQGGVAIAVNSRAADNTFQENLLVNNAKGAHVEGSAAPSNTFTGNQVTDNSHVGLWDDTRAAVTRYNSNACSRNKDANSVPDGLC